MEAAAPSREGTLAWEERFRVPAAVAAGLAGLTTLAGTILYQLVLADRPTVTVVEAVRSGLTARLEGRPVPGLQESLLRFFDSKASELILVSSLALLGGIAVAFALYFLFRATSARRPETPRWALPLAVAGGVLVGLCGVLPPGLLAQILTASRIDDLIAEGIFRQEAIEDELRAGGTGAISQIVSILGLAGQFALATGLALISLNAMRAGLLTRFMGFLGILVGVLIIIPIGSPLPIVQAFWLIFLGALFVGVTPTGRPPAWESGQAEPWPSQQEIREERERLRAAQAGGEPPAATTDPDAPAGTPHPVSKKKKRKRR